MTSDLNSPNKTLLSALEKRGLVEMTKSYFRAHLLETFKKDKNDINLYNTAPSGFNNINKIKIIKDPKTLKILKLQYSLIHDFLIRIKLPYTENILSEEITSLLESNIPFTGQEIIRNLNLDIKNVSNKRLNSNLNTDINDLVKSTYLYQLINKFCNFDKIDVGTQTAYVEEKNKKIDLEKELKKIEDKYNQNLNIEKVLPLSKFNEKKFLEYKEDLDTRYKENLHNEIERFKTVELSNMRLEENKKYLEKINKIKQEYEIKYEKKYEEIKNMKKNLEEKEKMIEKENDKKNIENNEQILIELRKIREDNDQRINEYINEINKLNNDKKILEQNIENMKEQYNIEMQNEIRKIKNEYLEKLDIEKHIIKQENEKEKKMLYNNYIKNNDILSNSSIINAKRKDSFDENKININSNIHLKNSNFNKKLEEDIHNRRKRIEEIEEEQIRFNNNFKYEFQNIRNQHTPIVLINQEEIDQIKNNNENINNIILSENKKESQRKKSLGDNFNKEIKSPKRMNPNFYNNNILNNSKSTGININSSMRNNNMGIPSANNFSNININNNNVSKINSGVIEENIDYENITSSQKEQSNKKSGSHNFNNINSNNNNFGSNKKSIFPPINNMSYSIKEEINISANKSKSKMGSSGKKSLENNINNVNINNFNKSAKKNEEDEYGEGDFENNISSLNQTSEKKTIRFGKIKNQNEKSMNIIENKDNDEDSYNDFENTKGLINKGINLEGSSNFNNKSKINNNKNTTEKKNNNDESEIKEDIEYDSNEF